MRNERDGIFCFALLITEFSDTEKNDKFVLTMSSRRGNHLYNELFPLDEAVTSTTQRRGRSEDQDAERNDRLIHRYLFYGFITGLRYELLTKIISIEFTLSQRTVQNLLAENNAKLRKIRASLPTKKELERKWPFLNWDKPELSYYI